jgi:group I intron endonuclease
LTAFLGLLHSPKRLKLNNYNNNIFSSRKHHSNNGNKPNSCYARLKQTNIKGKRDFSTSSRRGFTVTLSCKQDSEELTKFIAEKKLNPVFVYENLQDSTVKTRVINETRHLSGIYLILNKATLDYYIGSASTGRLHARFTNHLFNFNGSKVVKNAVKKYGIFSFAFIILELFPETVNKENNKRLLDLEDFYLKSLLPNYNILTEAGSSFGYKHTEITRLNMKAHYSEERRMTVGNLNKNKSLSPSIIELIRQAALNRVNPIYSAQSIQNMKKKSKAILLYNLDYTVYGEYPSIVDAAKSLGCSQKTISRALKSPKKILRRRLIVKYV